ncbi:BCCT family transporter [Campylobacter lari]|uniref:BCCT family transporter n=1 Tax=Campylobacter lari TaxID=201 RepID=UPI0013B70F6C|nr:BCCT family transporter [Campylobacter lari]EAI3897484.1 BCCT family transporter [Campylobacter lari]EAJ5696051.1 BCCT family transporter [Campylobacter lari]EDP6875382.1 BCCT family transporter [Campylobacter lari]EHC7929605.1 BCCT family transporter [Campylobacter lari]EKL1318166.1 BCCT family transporter [Campylobacter lari]
MLKTSFKKSVFIPSISIIIILSLSCIFLPKLTNDFINHIKSGIFTNFSWFYILSVSFFVCFMLALALSKFGDIKLGDDDEKPNFKFTSWLAMLFATGMGVGLMYFGVAEPLIHKKALQTSDEEAMLHTIFHWGIHPWAIYGVCALAMAYFGFRYKMPLSLRSAFYPLLKDKIYGFWGNLVDILALIVTVFGISTTLGYSASQLNAGFLNLGILNEQSFLEQSVIIIIIISLATLSSISGLTKGLKILSETNLVFAVCLMLFVLFSTNTIQILSQFSSNIGNYLQNLISLSFKTYYYEKEHIEWFNNWTIYYWAWWLSWSPFVGFFIAKISRGRTIREFIFGVLVVPTSFNILWFSIFGNSALNFNDILSPFTSAPESLLFYFLQNFSFSYFSSLLALLVLALFFITSADSGIFVLNSLSSGGAHEPHKWQNILWGFVLTLLATSLLYSGGLGAILSITMIVALPFAFLLCLMCFSLLKGLIVDVNYSLTKLSQSSVYFSGEFWQERLARILKQSKEQDIQNFLNTKVKNAMESLSQSLKNYGLKTQIVQEKSSISLIIKKEFAKDFIYGVQVVKKQASQSIIDDKFMPTYSKEFIFEPQTFFADSRNGYNIEYLNEQEIIVDILKQYERYLQLLFDDKNEIFTKAYD